MITAKNITDAQLRALLREAEEHADDADPKWQKQRDAAADALSAICNPSVRSSGRSHCAAILRARAAKGRL